MPLIALVYARVSADKSDQKISVDRQLKLCTAKAGALWPDAEVRVFRDDGITAANPDVHRPGYAAFIAAVRAAPRGSVAGVVVNEQSRLTRQPSQWNELVVTLTKAGVTEVETLRSGTISVEAGNRLVGGILALVDAEEVARTKARVQVAHRELFEEGRPAGRPPFGYRSVKDDEGRPAFEPDPVEAPLVEEMFEKVIKGHALQVIADGLNTGTVLPRSAAWKYKDGRKITQWNPGAVRTVLKSPTVAGLRGHVDEDGELHTVAATWEALIPVDQCRDVQRILGQPAVVTAANGETYKVRNKPPAQPRKYLLSGGRRRSGVPGQPGESYGLLRCGKCGSPMVAQSQERGGGLRVPAYACHPKSGAAACGGVSISPADEVEAVVVEAVQAALKTNPQLRQKLHAAEDAEVGRWRSERDAAKVRMLDAGKMLGSGTIDRDTFDVMHEPAKAAYDLAETRLASMTSDSALPSVEDVQGNWDGLTLKQRRAVLERLIDRIVIAPGQKTKRSGLNLARIGVPVWRA